MDLRKALSYEPPQDWARLQVIDSHTGGEPFRVIVGGLPDIEGVTVIERRRNAAANLESLRRLLMWEPRGHADMYGGILGPPERADSHLSVLFIHNAGFSTMCGHGIIALSKVVLDVGLIEVDGEDAELRIDTPAGQIVATSERKDGLVVATTFQNVPSFAPVLDAQVATDSMGVVEFDIGYGGAFYAYVDAASVGVSLDDPHQLISAGREIKRSVAMAEMTEHPDSPELGFLYGVIFTAPSAADGVHSRNVCVFADGEIDRSPTGTGVSGRLAIMSRRGQLAPGQSVTIESIIGSRFTATYANDAKVGDHAAVVPHVTGSAHITGRSEYWVDPSDDIGRGFLVR